LSLSVAASPVVEAPGTNVLLNPETNTFELTADTSHLTKRAGSVSFVQTDSNHGMKVFFTIPTTQAIFDAFSRSGLGNNLPAIISENVLAELLHYLSSVTQVAGAAADFLDTGNWVEQISTNSFTVQSGQYVSIALTYTDPRQHQWIGNTWQTLVDHTRTWLQSAGGTATVQTVANVAGAAPPGKRNAEAEVDIDAPLVAKGLVARGSCRIVFQGTVRLFGNGQIARSYPNQTRC
jgi:hypothetical protein